MSNFTRPFTPIRQGIQTRLRPDRKTLSQADANHDPLPLRDPQAEADQEPPSIPYSFWLGALTLQGSASVRVLPTVFGFGAISFATVLFCHMMDRFYDISLAVSVGPFEAAGAVLGLLLVLRTNAGYDRWWEARKLWGGIVNQSRNMVLTALAYGPIETAWRVKFVRWSAAFPHVIRRSLRGQRVMPEIDRLLGQQECERIAKAEHMPDFVARELASMLQIAQAAGMPPWAFYECERQRSLLIDHLGGCERILKTPLARSMAIKVRRFILLFLLTLPFALLHSLNVSYDVLFGVTMRECMVPLFVMLTAYPLLALDRIGMELQNPFDRRRLDHLPLDQICMTIEKNLLEMLNFDQQSTGGAGFASVEAEPPPDASLGYIPTPFNADIS